MKTLELTKGIRLVLVTIFVIVVGAIIAGAMSNEEVRADGVMCSCGSTSVDLEYAYDSPGWHWQHTDCGVCGTRLDARLTPCTPGDWAPSANLAGTHAKYCMVCHYATTTGTCYDNGGDGSCDVCGGTIGSSGSGGGTGKECTCSGGSDSYDEDYRTVDNMHHNLYYVCNDCGGEWFDAQYIHKYDSMQYTNNGNGTHSVDCRYDCGYTKTEEHDFENGVCAATGCGATQVCEHTYGLWSNNGNGKHIRTCTICNATEEQNHTYENGACTTTGCNATCSHTYGSWSNSGSGKHTRTCTICNETEEQNHTYENGVCTATGCNATCSHTYGSWTNNGNGKHIRTCTKCSATDSQDHTFENGTCTATGCNATCSHTYGSWSNNGNGKHTRTCTSCNKTETQNHTFTNGTCTATGCNATCSHTYGSWSDNGNGQHKRTCTICSKVETQNHNYSNGKCINCGKQELQQEQLEVESETYEINSTDISEIQPGTTVSQLKANVATNATSIKIYNSSNQEISDNQIGTGMRIEFIIGEETKTFTIIIKGDVNEDGVSDITDIFSINSHRIGVRQLTGAYLKAADVNGSGTVDVSDIFKINSYRLQGGEL